MKVQPEGPVILRSTLLGEWPWLRHGFSTRRCGTASEFDLSEAGGVARRRRFAAAVAAPVGKAMPLVLLRQIHGSNVWPAEAIGGGGDALTSGAAGHLLAVRTADCLPILVADGKRRAVAAIHAGWRGTLLRVVEKTVGEMRARYGSDPLDLRAVIGPSIRGCCYEVGETVRQAFAARFHGSEEWFTDNEDDPLRNRYPVMFMTGAPPGHPYDPRWNRETPLRLDLAAANRRQLLAAGLAASAIEVMPYCTSCRGELFYSHRRAARSGAAEGRMLAAIGIASSRDI